LKSLTADASRIRVKHSFCLSRYCLEGACRQMCDADSDEEPDTPAVVPVVVPAVVVGPAPSSACWGPFLPPVTRARFTMQTENMVRNPVGLRSRILFF
jgi:hypothetical protein